MDADGQGQGHPRKWPKGEDFDQNATIIDAELKAPRNPATIEKAYGKSQGCAKDEC